MGTKHIKKSILAVLLALMMILAVIPAQAFNDNEDLDSASEKLGTGAQPENESDGRIVMDAKLDGEPERLLSDHSSQSLCIAPDSNGAYYGDYIIIYNPDYDDEVGKSTGSLSGMIDTSVLYHLDGSRDEECEEAELSENSSVLCGTTELMKSVTTPIDLGPEGERTSYSVGSTRDFTLTYSPISDTNINCTCLAVGDHCYIWTPTDKTDPNLLPLDSFDPTYADLYANEFDSKFPLMQSSFGDHWNGTQGDGKVHLVFYNISNPSWSGFFWSVDFDNNHVPMVNISTNFLRTNPASFLFGTIVHEYQHLIHYSVCHAYNRSDNSWLTEMMSAAAEEICYPGSSVSSRIPHWLGLNATGSYAANPYFERENNLYYAQSGQYSLYDWENLSGFNAVSQYGRASLYAQFLYSHLGVGNEIFKVILNCYASNQDITAGQALEVVSVAYAQNYGWNIEAVNRAFWISMVMNPSPGSTPISQAMYNAYGFSVQPGYNPADYNGVDNPYNLLCPLIYTSIVPRTIKGGMALVVKPINKRFVPPSGASSGLEYIGVFTNEKLHYDTVNGDFNTSIYNYAEYPFTPYNGIAKSTNGGIANSQSTVSYSASGDIGSVRFSAYVSGEGSGTYFYDGLKVYLVYNDNTYFQFQTYSTNNSWQDYELTLPVGTTSAAIIFSYSKDSGVDNGSDCAYIDDVEFVARQLPALNDALNYENGSLSFTTSSDYPFYVDYFQSDDVGVSGNAGVNNSSSYITCRVPMYCGDKIWFEYFYDTEQNYDWFDFTVNGTNLIHGSGSISWHSYTYTAYTAGIYTFVWTYTKDTSNHVGQDCVMLDNIRYISDNGQTYTLDDSLNTNGGNLHFTADSWPTFSGDYWNTESIATAYNFRTPNSTATVSTTVDMLEGDELRFEYYVSSEENFDLFKFKVNGSPEMTVSGNHGWRLYQFFAPETGTYNFEWSYLKDSSVDKYMDTVKLDNVEHITYYPSLDSVLNTNESDYWLHFVPDGDYPFGVNRNDIDFIFAESSNYDIDSSTSSMFTTIYLNPGDRLSFLYFVSSEENYDFLDFDVNGVNKLHESGEVGWTVFSYTAASSGVHTFEWTYSKDSSRSEGYDCARIKWVTVEEAANVSVPGDVNNDGSVDTTDALMVLRYSLGVVTSLPNLAAADVDGSGGIDTIDALMILRASLGIISLK